MWLLPISAKHGSEEKLVLLAAIILDGVDSSDCAVVYKEILAISQRNGAVKKAIDEYYKKLQAVLFEAISQAALKISKTNKSLMQLLSYYLLSKATASPRLTLRFYLINYRNN